MSPQLSALLYPVFNNLSQLIIFVRVPVKALEKVSKLYFLMNLGFASSIFNLRYCTRSILSHITVDIASNHVKSRKSLVMSEKRIFALTCKAKFFNRIW